MSLHLVPSTAARQFFPGSDGRPETMRSTTRQAPRLWCLWMAALAAAQEEPADAGPSLQRAQRQWNDWMLEKFYFKDDDESDYDSSDDSDEDDDGRWGDGDAVWQQQQQRRQWEWQPPSRGSQFRPQPGWAWSPPAPAGAAARPKAGGEAGAAGSPRCGVTIEVPRIISGKQALRGEFPWQAALKSTYCGGALIHPRFVLTAAHCFDPKVIKGYRLVEVRLGLLNQKTVDQQARSLAPDKQIPHPNYRGGYTAQRVRNQDDIALLRLAQPAPYTEFIRPVCLPDSKGNRLRANGISSPMVVAGWGLTERGVFSDNLLFARVPPVDPATCAQKLNIKVPATQLCAGGNVTDTCNGDSGGPLVQANENDAGDMVFEVVALVSFGPVVCGTPGLPAGYTRVAPYRAWIDQTIREQG
ncbi:Melanization protease 1 [Gryllus bimaculatus]|nr:Melanization protease 1 [Gryllus bimaculatus]